MQALRGAAIFVLLLATVAACGGGDGRESGTPAVAASRPAGWSLVAPMSQRRSYFASAGLCRHCRAPSEPVDLDAPAGRCAAPAGQAYGRGRLNKALRRPPCGATAAPASVLAPLQI